ncbi:hypothetical protein Desmu_1001 [Desulfurococcus mucosus DSM 2162]|uniref:CRISPR-associated protein Cas6 C-terminal domain-containing protein n=1 Tax=Desulfurococcus mucosus (strain ATCC 35584 / DSM 2162 / JCM 9187 / O7/1) TaxID=765177 RepID=E8R9X7_DESM0|nr:hypothetical protein Desmu_1001 [Desulfurococcus mucosus DSM 2162]
MKDVDPSVNVARVLVFRVRFLEQAELPVWKGNIIRGAIGSVLPKVCGFKRLNCGKCLIWYMCPFGYLYRARSKGIVLRKLRGVSKPFVLKPPLTDARSFSPGDMLEFSAVLAGDAVRFEKDLLVSVLELGGRGLGVKSARGRFEVVEVAARNPVTGFESIVYRGGSFFDSRAVVTVGDLVKRASEISSGKSLQASFLTPYRVVEGGVAGPLTSFESLVKSALRRFSVIMPQYMYVNPVRDVGKLLEEARKVGLAGADLHRVPIVYRGKREDYYVGTYEFKGEIGMDVALLLAFSELFHIGKRASYGHGWPVFLPG